MVPLSDRQQIVLDGLVAIAAKGQALPSNPDLARRLGLSDGNAVSGALQRLETKGYIAYDRSDALHVSGQRIRAVRLVATGHWLRSASPADGLSTRSYAVYYALHRAAMDDAPCPINEALMAVASIPTLAGVHDTIAGLLRRQLIVIEQVGFRRRRIFIEAVQRWTGETAVQPRPGPVARNGESALSPGQRRIYDALIAAADAGEYCPSNFALSIRANFLNPTTASSAVNRIMDAGLIDIAYAGRQRAITIVATGQVLAFDPALGRHVRTARSNASPSARRSTIVDDRVPRFSTGPLIVLDRTPCRCCGTRGDLDCAHRPAAMPEQIAA